MYKLLSRANRAQKREEGDFSLQQFMQSVKYHDQISTEMEEALHKALAHECTGFEVHKWARTVDAPANLGN